MQNNFKSFWLSYFLGFAVLVSIFSCATDEGGNITTLPEEDEDNITTPIDFPDPDGVMITTISGLVLGQDENPIEGAEVVCQTCVTQTITKTDANGNFLMQDVENRGTSAYLTVEYAGMFKAFRRMGVLENIFNYTQVKLKNKERIGQVGSAQGGTLEHDSGATITLPPEAVVDAAGTSYNGPIEVYAAWINPEATDLNQNMVGDLSGIDENSVVQALSTYGMLTIELVDPLGNELNVAEGKEALLKFPVPQSMLANAPAIIPLWSYNEDNGYWVEEGEAELIDGFYEGLVEHFSSWNVDTKGDPIDISGQIFIRHGGSDITPAYYQVFVCGATIGQRGGWLSEDGSFLFYNFPANEPFILKVMDYCGEIVHQENYEGIPASEQLNNIIINSGPDIEFKVVSGSAVDCNMEPVTNGLVNLEINDRTLVFPLEEGQFDFSIPVCDNFNADLVVIDINNLASSDQISFSDLDASFEFSGILVCSQIENYVQYSVDGIPSRFSTEFISMSRVQSPSGTLGDYYFFFDDGVNGGVLLFINFGQDIIENQLGYTDDVEVSVAQNVSALNGWGNNPDFEFVMTTYDPQNEKFAAFFNGTVTDSNGVDYDVSGSFNLLE